MKRLGIFFLAMLTLGTLAWAGSSTFLGSTVASGSLSAPSGTTGGYDLPQPGSLKSLTVTASDVRDGSVGDTLDSVLVVNAYAWCYPGTQNARSASGSLPSSTTLAPDGGGGWSRLPALDVRMGITDAGTGIAGTGTMGALSGMATLSTPGIDCSRIAYSTDSVNASWDGGTLVYRLGVSAQY